MLWSHRSLSKTLEYLICWNQLQNFFLLQWVSSLYRLMSIIMLQGRQMFNISQDAPAQSMSLSPSLIDFYPDKGLLCSFVSQAVAFGLVYSQYLLQGVWRPDTWLLHQSCNIQASLLGQLVWIYLVQCKDVQEGGSSFKCTVQLYFNSSFFFFFLMS